jgi:hypothetical protein
MALKLSTGLRDKMLGLKGTVVGAIIGITLDFVDGSGGDDTITDSNTGFITAGFAPGDVLFVQGSTSNDGPCTGAVLTAVVAGTITFATGTVAGTEVALAGTVVAIARGGSLKDIFKDGQMHIYSGSQPSSPDAAVAGTLLLTVTESAGAFVHGAFDNALEFEDDPTDGEMEKASGETWQGDGVAAGTAGYFRLVANPTDNGAADTVLPRVDGSVGTSGADLNMSTTTITVGATYTIDSFKLTLPQYYGA